MASQRCSCQAARHPRRQGGVVEPAEAERLPRPDAQQRPRGLPPRRPTARASTLAQRVAQHRQMGEVARHRPPGSRDRRPTGRRQVVEHVPGADLVALVRRIGDAMGEEEQAARHLPVRLAEAADERRPEQVGDGQRQPLPGGDHQLVFRVDRVVVRQPGAGAQPVAVVQRLRLEPPVLLEVEGAGARLAAAEVEQPRAALARRRGASPPSTGSRCAAQRRAPPACRRRNRAAPRRGSGS